MKRWIISAVVLSFIGLGSVSAQDNPTPVPTSTSTPAPEIATDTANQADITSTPLVISPLLDLPIQAPITIDLPDDWGFAYNVFVYADLDGRIETVPFAYYEGPVTNGTGTIILLWGFDSVVNPFEGQGMSPWLDGLRLLRLVIMDNECNIGTAPERDYSVGEIAATGTQFSAVDCPEGIPDTRGWFAAAFVDNVNFAFYMYIDPLQPAGTPAEFDLQQILDTIEFRVEDLRVSQEELSATQAAYLTALPQITITPQATESAGG
ncbi:MAG: hypothetical protein Q9P01_21700 [Anaerolineae bacterium]|nr:hypothetical protein [Anaerolineae bacterium]MDQ7037359.1 hypothetical protein [Anaerolineae bacterium]